MKTGFTLVEVLLATIIVGALVGLIGGSLGGSARATAKAKVVGDATQLLQKKLTEFQVEHQGKNIDSIKEEESGDFGSDYPEFKWKITAQPMKIPAITSKDENKETAALQDMVAKTLAQYLETAVREVSIKVTHTRKTKIQDFVVTTHFIDYSKEIQVGTP